MDEYNGRLIHKYHIQVIIYILTQAIALFYKEKFEEGMEVIPLRDIEVLSDEDGLTFWFDDNEYKLTIKEI